MERAVAKSVTPAQWSHLYSRLFALKRRQMEHVDLDRAEACFPPEFFSEPWMIGYGEVFPFADPPVFNRQTVILVSDISDNVPPGAAKADKHTVTYDERIGRIRIDIHSWHIHVPSGQILAVNKALCGKIRGWGWPSLPLCIRWSLLLGLLGTLLPGRLGYDGDNE